MIDLFSLVFFRNAFLISIVLAPLFGMISFFVVMRRMAFLGAGIAHMAFGGVALGIFLGVQPFAVSLIFCMAAAMLMGRLAKAGRISSDTSIGLFFSFSMALGAMLIAARRAYAFDLSGYLFGNILGVSSLDLILVLTVALLFLPFICFLFQKLLFMTFEEQTARVSGVRTGILETALLGFLAMIIVVSIKIVGIILVSALTVLPASFGLSLSRRYRTVLWMSIGFALFIMIGGLFLSYFLDTPAGATMVVLGTVAYFIVMAFRLVLRR